MYFKLTSLYPYTKVWPHHYTCILFAYQLCILTNNQKLLTDFKLLHTRSETSCGTIAVMVLSTPASSTTKTGRHDIAEILLKT